ncbi:MAG: hypothetical protein ACHP84_11530 [Caulobacterales bacterium]
MSRAGPDHVVHEAIGPPLSAREAAAAIAVGVNSLLVLGVLPVLLGALAQEHRLTEAGIGQAAMIELLAMGLATALTGIAVKPRRLKLIGALASLLLAGCDLATSNSGQLGVFMLRGAAGALEGVLLWITVGMISRTATPERWAGVFFTAQTAAQLILAVAFAAWIMRVYGAAGGFTSLAICSLAGVVPAFFTPSRYADLNPGETTAGAPSTRGWIALAGTLVYVSASAAVGVYLQPLALQAGLDRGRGAHGSVGLAGRPGGGRRRGHGPCRPGALVRRVPGDLRRLSGRLVAVRPEDPRLGVRLGQRHGGPLRPVPRPVPGAHDHRGRSLSPGSGAERRRAAAGRRPGTFPRLADGQRTRRPWRAVARRRTHGGRPGHRDLAAFDEPGYRQESC